MAREFKRTDRIADEMQKELAVLIQREIKDPRLGMMVTVSGVQVSTDLAHAKVFVTFLGRDTQAEVAEALKVLNGAAGYLRTELSRRIKLRTMPALKFQFDASLLRGRALSNLIDQAIAEDKTHDHGEG